MAYIYIITNIKNNKHYIGKTVSSVRKRVLEHFNDYTILMSLNTKLLRAILKYGKDCWKYSTLEECSLEKASEREMYYISKYNTHYDGYNSTLGGEGQLRYNYDIDDIVKRYNSGESTSSIAKIYGCHPHRIAEVLKQADIELRVSKPIIIVCFDRKRRPIQIFNSKREVAKYLSDYGYTQSMGNVYNYIKDACENGSCRYNRYWEYYDESKHRDIKMTGVHEYKGDKGRAIAKQERSSDIKNKPECICKHCGIKIRTSVERDVCYNCEAAINKGIPPKPSKEEFLELLDKYLLKELADTFKRSQSTIRYWVKQYKNV